VIVTYWFLVRVLAWGTFVVGLCGFFWLQLTWFLVLFPVAVGLALFSMRLFYATLGYDEAPRRWYWEIAGWSIGCFVCMTGALLFFR
jgi:hypothetical protein